LVLSTQASGGHRGGRHHDAGSPLTAEAAPLEDEMAELLLASTIVGGVGLGLFAAKASLGWVVDRIPTRAPR
jgi:predicted secreted protein